MDDTDDHLPHCERCGHLARWHRWVEGDRQAPRTRLLPCEGYDWRRGGFPVRDGCACPDLELPHPSGHPL